MRSQTENIGKINYNLKLYTTTELALLMLPNRLYITLEYLHWVMPVQFSFIKYFTHVPKIKKKNKGVPWGCSG